MAWVKFTVFAGDGEVLVNMDHVDTVHAGNTPQGPVLHLCTGDKDTRVRGSFADVADVLGAANVLPRITRKPDDPENLVEAFIQAAVRGE